MSRNTLLVLAIVTLLGGCASSLEYKRSRDGTKEEVTESARCVGLLCSTPSRAVYVAPAYGTYGYDRDYYDRRYDDYEPPYRIRPGEVCRGSFGQTIDGICYPEKPRWMR